MIDLDKQRSKETFYNVLSVDESASYEEIRANYRAAVLSLHPDKIKSKQAIQDPDEVRERFVKIQEAWEVLGDRESRAAYDKELKSTKSDPPVYAHEIEMKDLGFRDCGDALELVFPCRCGDFFSVSSDDLGEMGFRLEGSRVLRGTGNSVPEPVAVAISCPSCSLMICLTLDCGV